MTERRIEHLPEVDKPQWREESFYFGNANYPSDATYRRDGERLQIRVEMPIPLQRDGNIRYKANMSYRPDFSDESVTDFLAKYQDCEILVHDSYQLASGKTQPPSLFVTGWQELTTEEDKTNYFQNKLDGGNRHEFTLQDVQELLEGIKRFDKKDVSVTLHHLHNLSSLGIIADNTELKVKIQERIDELSSI